MFESDSRLRQIAYLSFGKVNDLYDQISDFSPASMQVEKGAEIEANASSSVDTSILSLFKLSLGFGAKGHQKTVVEGNLGTIQKLAKVLEALERRNQIGSLNAFLESGKIDPKANCYTYSGTFKCLEGEELDKFLGVERDYVEQEKKVAEYSPLRHGLRTTGGMCVLSSKSEDARLYLVCSFKYFTDMGSSRIRIGDDYSDQDLLDIHPHSMNYMFFSGKHEANFDVVLFLTGRKGNELYGSPLAIVNSFSI